MKKYAARLSHENLCFARTFKQFDFSQVYVHAGEALLQQVKADLECEWIFASYSPSLASYFDFEPVLPTSRTTMDAQQIIPIDTNFQPYPDQPQQETSILTRIKKLYAM